MSRSKVASVCLFLFFKLPNGFQSGCIILHSDQQCVRALVSPQAGHLLALSELLVIGTPACVAASPFVSVCISLNDGCERLSMYLFIISLCSWVTCFCLFFTLLMNSCLHNLDVIPLLGKWFATIDKVNIFS